MKTVEVKVAENETISVEEFAKIEKKTVRKNYDAEKAEMEAIKADMRGGDDDYYDYEEDEEEVKQAEEKKEQRRKNAAGGK